jgi:cytochrome c553
VLVLALGCAAAAFASGDPVAGARKNSMCRGCHGIPSWRNAYPPYSVPRLGGQHAQYFVSALQEYKSRARSNSTMQAIAAGLSDQDMEDLAAYYSAQPEKTTPSTAAGGQPLTARLPRCALSPAFCR